MINSGTLQAVTNQSIAFSVGAHTVISGSQAFYVDNVERAAMVLSVEATYTFNLDTTTFASVGGHHLHFSETSDGTHNSGTAYTTHLTNAGATSGFVLIV